MKRLKKTLTFLSLILSVSLAGGVANAAGTAKAIPEFQKKVFTQKSLNRSSDSRNQFEFNIKGSPQFSTPSESNQPASKLDPDLRERLKTLQQGESIHIEVSLDYSSGITIEKFIRTILTQKENHLDTIKVNRRTAFIFDTEANKQQIDSLAGLKEVDRIGLRFQKAHALDTGPLLNTRLCVLIGSRAV